MKIYKIGFWFFLISFPILLNYLRFNNIRYDNEIESLKIQNKKRINSLLLSTILTARRMDDIKCRNIITGETKQKIFQKNSLIILLNKFKCNKCQENELKRLDSLKSIFESKGLNVFGIISQSQKDVAIRQRKLLRLTYPIYWVEDSVFYKLSNIQSFPQILLVSDNTILSAFFPIVKDDEFSKIYYKELIDRLNQIIL